MVGIFSDTSEARSFKLRMIITLLGFYIVIGGLITLTLLQGHRCVRNVNFKLRVLNSCPLKFNRRMVATYIKNIMHNMICVLRRVFNEKINLFFVDQESGLVETFNVEFCSDTIHVMNVKRCVMVLLTKLYLFMPVVTGVFLTT